MKIIAFIGGSSSGTEITVVADYNALPPANTVGGQFYWCSNPVTHTSFVFITVVDHINGLYYSNGITWEFLDTPIQATQAEVDAGTIEDKFVSPKTFNDSLQLSQASILSKLGFYQYQINIASALVTTTSPTIVGNIPIPANTYNASGGKFEFNMFAVKTSTVSQITIEAWLGPNSNNLDGATRIATSGAMSINARYAPLRRKANFNGTDIIGLSFSSGNINDDTANSGVPGSLAFDETIDNFLMFVIILVSSSNNAYLQFAEFKNF